MTTTDTAEEIRINARVRGPLAAHVQERIGPAGIYESQSEYIRDLIRHDMGLHDDLSASIDRGLDDIKEGRYHKWDVEKIRKEGKARIAAAK